MKRTLLALLAAVFFIACGGGGQSTPPPAAAPVPDETAPAAPEATEPAEPTTEPAAMSDEELGALIDEQIALIQEMSGVLAANTKDGQVDCAAAAQALDTWREQNQARLESMAQRSKNVDEQRAQAMMQERMQPETMQDFAAGMMSCSQDPAFQASMEKFNAIGGE